MQRRGLGYKNEHIANQKLPQQSLLLYELLRERPCLFAITSKVNATIGFIPWAFALGQKIEENLPCLMLFVERKHK